MYVFENIEDLRLNKKRRSNSSKQASGDACETMPKRSIYQYYVASTVEEACEGTKPAARTINQLSGYK